MARHSTQAQLDAARRYYLRNRAEQRAKKLQYYYDHREQILARQKAERMGRV